MERGDNIVKGDEILNWKKQLIGLEHGKQWVFWSSKIGYFFKEKRDFVVSQIS
jgi:hypothetical protein